MNLQSEGVRIPMWLTTILVALVLPAVTALLTGVEWRVAGLQAVAALGVLLGGTEVARRNVYSTKTVDEATNGALMAGRYEGFKLNFPELGRDDVTMKDRQQEAVLEDEADGAGGYIQIDGRLAPEVIQGYRDEFFNADGMDV